MKTSSIALAALLLVGSLAAPAFAASYGDSSNSSFDRDFLLTQLRAKGVNAVDVAENANDKVRATVVLENGQQVFQYFDEETLQPVGGAKVSPTRVLSKLDVGQPVANSPYSLLAPDTDHDN